MRGFFKNLLEPEDHADPYLWASVMLAHVAMGVMGWSLIGLWAVGLYVVFEGVQAAVARRVLVHDTAIDVAAVLLGALIARGLYIDQAADAAVATAIIAGLTVTGVAVKLRNLR